nr:hypothetical protein [Tanacetum cinerariifolium]
VKKLVTTRVDLRHNADLYKNMSERYTQVKGEHDGCVDKLQTLKSEKNELSSVNNDQALCIKELEDELAKKDSTLVYAERLLPTAITRLLQSHEYKQSLSEPFNPAIQASWAKGLAEGHFKEDNMNALYRVEGFDAYSDKKIYVEFDKLFEKKYPYVEKIASGFRHSVADLLKVYPALALLGKSPIAAPSKTRTGTSAPSIQKKKA